VVLDTEKFISDIFGGVLKDYTLKVSGVKVINLSAYIIDHQKKTDIYDYVNNDVSILYFPTEKTFEITDFDHYTPDDIYTTIRDMIQILKPNYKERY